MEWPAVVNRRGPLATLAGLVAGMLIGGSACTDVVRRIAPIPTPTVPAATPHPRDLPPAGARLSPHTVERTVLDTLPFPANTLAIETIRAVYNGDGTWTVEASIAERLRPSAAPAGGPPGRPELVTTHFVWTISDHDRSIVALNPAGQEWMARHWHPGP